MDGDTTTQDRAARGPLVNDTIGVAVVWFASRASVFLAAWYATWVLAGDAKVTFGSDDDSVPPLGPIAAWNQWDLAWYVSIARDGYGAPGFESSYAFMPGFPSLLWAFGKLNVHPTLTGLVISAAAGFLAALAVAALTRSIGGRGELGVMAWVLAPTAVFLAAPYTEALFCAFAFWAWLLARRASWLAAGLLASGACLVRVNGLFLACGLVVLFLTTRARRWREAPWLLLPFLTLIGIAAYFRSRTASWASWLDSQSTGWHREFTNPIETLQATINHAFNIGLSATFNIQTKLELVFVALLVVLAVLLLIKRWWGEGTYVLLTVAALSTSNLYYSVPRASLTIFPLWMLLGAWMTRRTWVTVAYVAVSGPLMLVGVVGFVSGRWIA